MTITYNLADFAGLVPPATVPSPALDGEIRDIVFVNGSVLIGINHIGGSDAWVLRFNFDPTGGDLLALNDVIEAHTAAPLRARAAVLRQLAPIDGIDSDVFTNVLDDPFVTGPLVGGAWELTVSLEVRLDSPGGGKIVQCQITRDNVQIAQMEWDRARYAQLPPFVARLRHLDGENPSYGIEIRRIGGNPGDEVFARRIRMALSPTGRSNDVDQ